MIIIATSNKRHDVGLININNNNNSIHVNSIIMTTNIVRRYYVL